MSYDDGDKDEQEFNEEMEQLSRLSADSFFAFEAMLDAIPDRDPTANAMPIITDRRDICYPSPTVQ